MHAFPLFSQRPETVRRKRLQHRSKLSQHLSQYVVASDAYAYDAEIGDRLIDALPRRRVQAMVDADADDGEAWSEYVALDLHQRAGHFLVAHQHVVRPFERGVGNA